MNQTGHPVVVTQYGPPLPSPPGGLLFLNIFAIFCCWPISIASFIFYSNASTAAKMGDRNGISCQFWNFKNILTL